MCWRTSNGQGKKQQMDGPGRIRAHNHLLPRLLQNAPGAWGGARKGFKWKIIVLGSDLPLAFVICLDPTKVSLIPILHHPSSFHSTSPSKHSDVSQPVQATASWRSSWGYLGPAWHMPGYCENYQQPCRIVAKNPGFQSYTWPPASFHKTDIQWQETGPASCETISADAAQPPCCVTVSCTAWWVHASSAVTAPDALVFDTPNLRVSHLYEIGQLFDSASKLLKQPKWGNEKAWINRYFRWSTSTLLNEWC